MNLEKYATKTSLGLYNIKFQFVLMMRVNPDKIRNPGGFPVCWILSGNDDEIRQAFLNDDISCFHSIDTKMLENFLVVASKQAHWINEDRIKEILEEVEQLNKEINNQRGEKMVDE